MRISVCAEVYGEFNKKEDFQPPVHNKSKDQIDQIIAKLKKSFLFSHLEQKEQVTIALAMKQVPVSKDDFIIKQGDNGNEVYIVSQGTFECSKKFSDDKEKFLC
jgi:cAMP-dependent protein kinase regulator